MNDKSHGKLVIVKTYKSRMEAEIAKGLLESNGIPAHVSVDDAGGMYPPFNFGGGAKILVPEKFKEKAAKLLEV
jgi:hypothetical protein